MKNKEHISIGELMELLLIKDIRTINSYIKTGKLPKPTEDGNRIFFLKDDIAKRLRVSNLEEPFIMIEEAAEILGISTGTVIHYAKKNALPHYRLDFSKSQKLLFRESEVKLYNEISLVWSTGFVNNHNKFWYFKRILRDLILDSEEVIRVLSGRERQVLRAIMVEDKKISGVAEMYDLSGERVRQIFEKANRKIWLLRRRMKDKLQQYDDLKAEKWLVDKRLGNLRKEYDTLADENNKLRERLGMPPGDYHKKRVMTLELVKLLSTRFVDLDLSVRALNSLRAADIETLGELIRFKKNDLLKFRNFGPKSLKEIEALIDEKGLRFGMSPRGA